MAQNLNKVSSVIKGSSKTTEQLQAELNATAKAMGEKMKKINIPPVYKASFGDPMTFTVNGVRVEIPLGESMFVPEPHYLHAQRLMRGAVFVKGQERPKPDEIYND